MHRLQKRLSEFNTPEDEYPVPELEKKMSAEPIKMQLDKEWSVVA